MENNSDEITVRNDIPNVLIFTTKENTFKMIRFSYRDGKLDVSECALSEDLDDDMISGFPEIRDDQVIFARIKYEFDFDDSEGIMEMSLHEIIDLHDHGDVVCVEDMVKSNIEFMSEVYAEHICNFYSF